MKADVFVVKLNASNWRSVVVSLENSGLAVSCISISEIFFLDFGSIIILPGVGNISSIYAEFETACGVRLVSKYIVNKSIKVIGICLGFQFMCQLSDEDPSVRCLEFYNLEVKSLHNPPRPSVGWFSILHKSGSVSDELFEIINDNYFYFTHSYGVICQGSISSEHDIYCYRLNNETLITAAIVRKNFIGYQFHPEKSGKIGQDLLYKSVIFLRRG